MRKIAPSRSEDERNNRRVKRLRKLISEHEQKTGKKLTQKAIGEMAGVSMLTIHRILAGESLLNDPKTLEGLAHAFDVPLSYFVDDSWPDDSDIVTLNVHRSHLALIEQTLTILQSSTGWAQALEADIRALYSILLDHQRLDQEIQKLSKRIEELESDN